MRTIEAPRTTHTVAIEAFGRFFRREFVAMVGLAEAVSGDPSAAEDLAAEALSRAHARWDEVGRYDKPGAWVRRVTINLARSHGRRLATRQRFLRRQAPPEVIVPPDADHELWAAVATLAPKQRAAIALHYLHDLPVAEIAEILECSVSTATSHLHAGRSRLAQILDEEDVR